MLQALWKISWQLLKKFSIKLPCDLAIALPGIYPRVLKAPCTRGLYAPSQQRYSPKLRGGPRANVDKMKKGHTRGGIAVQWKVIQP